MSRVKNKDKRCRVCGAKVHSNKRYCKLCWAERKVLRNVTA